MYQIILLIYVFVAICIIALVLVQQGKGATLGAAFGSGASQTVFGSRGSGSFLFRLTIGFAAIFFAAAIVLNYLVMHAYKQEKVITLPMAPTHQTQGTTSNAGSPQVPSTATLPSDIPVRGSKTK